MSAHSYRQYVFFLSADRNEVIHLMSLSTWYWSTSFRVSSIGVELLCELSLDDEHRHCEHPLSVLLTVRVARDDSQVPEWHVDRNGFAPTSTQSRPATVIAEVAIQ